MVGGTDRNSKDVQQHVQKRETDLARRGTAAFPRRGRRGEGLLFGGHAAGQGEGADERLPPLPRSVELLLKSAVCDEYSAFPGRTEHFLNSD